MHLTCFWRYLHVYCIIYCVYTIIYCYVDDTALSENYSIYSINQMPWRNFFIPSVGITFWLRLVLTSHKLLFQVQSHFVHSHRPICSWLLSSFFSHHYSLQTSYYTRFATSNSHYHHWQIYICDFFCAAFPFFKIE